MAEANLPQNHTESNTSSFELVSLDQQQITLIEKMTETYKRSLSVNEWESLIPLFESVLISVHDGSVVSFVFNTNR